MKTSWSKALACCYINRKLDGLLLSGPSGVGKSYLPRMAMREWGMPVINLPLHVSEDMLTESLDVEKTLQQGVRIYEKGILDRAFHGFLYVDDINLLRPSVMKILYTLRRGNLRPNYTLVASMNPEAGVLSQSDLEGFTIFVDMENPGFHERVDVLRSKITGEGTDTISLDYSRKELEEAKERCTKVEASPAMLALVSAYCIKSGAGGNEVDTMLLEMARALAALDGKDYILPRHIEEATLYILPHRMRKKNEAPQEPEEENSPSEQEENQQESDADSEGTEEEFDGEEETEREESEDDKNEKDEDSSNNSSHESSALSEISGEQIAKIGQYLLGMRFDTSGKADRFNRRGSGKRMLTRTDMNQGRYVRAQIPRGKMTDLALDATIRAAAPHQKWRGKGKLAIAIRKSDWRSKVREKRIGGTFLFVVDASGSMGAKRRMEATKGAIYALLQDAYEKRDRVGLICFRREQAEVLLPFTRSIELAQRYLEDLPTGGKTPLAEGLRLAHEELYRLMLRESHADPVLLLVTDGRATWAKGNVPPVEAARTEAEKLYKLNIKSIVIDTEREFISLGIAKKLAKELRANYYSVKDINDKTIISAVRALGE